MALMFSDDGGIGQTSTDNSSTAGVCIEFHADCVCLRTLCTQAFSVLVFEVGETVILSFHV